MAELVEVVIKIPKYYLTHPEDYTCLVECVKRGIVLPKGHGDLKDMNDLCYKSRYGCKGNCDYLHTCNSYGAPTIIKADAENKPTTEDSKEETNDNINSKESEETHYKIPGYVDVDLPFE